MSSNSFIIIMHYLLYRNQNYQVVSLQKDKGIPQSLSEDELRRDGTSWEENSFQTAEIIDIRKHAILHTS